jgi:cysteine synthase A
MLVAGVSGSVVTLLCDPGDRYTDTLYDDRWLEAEGIDLGPWVARLDRFLSSGTWHPANAGEGEATGRGEAH